MNLLEWYNKNCKGIDDIQDIYSMYNQFKESTGSQASEESFKRCMRKIYYHQSKVDNSKVKIMKEAEGPNLNIVSQSHEIRTLEQLLAYCKIDLQMWKVNKHVVNMWGSESNSNFQVKAWLQRKENIENKDALDIMIEEAKKYAVKYPKINYVKRIETENLLEISLFDHHYGQMSWGKETMGVNYNIKTAAVLVLDAVRDILSRANEIKLDKILLIIGNDFFNVNSQDNTTVAGTSQSEDDRWKKTFANGLKLWVQIIEMCMQIVPVDVLIIAGNHDEERTYYLGTALDAWFHGCKDVKIDNSPPLRKYYRWGKCLIGYTHGDKEPKGTLIPIMATEKPQDWSETKYREWHKGHLHHASETAFNILDEQRSIREWILPSLVALDDYHAGKGYRSLRESIGMIWNKNKGKTDMFMYHPIEGK